MLKAQFSKERLDGYGVAAGAEFCNVKVRHPYRNDHGVQPTFCVTLRIWRWQWYFMVYKPAQIRLNRKERRANNLK